MEKRVGVEPAASPEPEGSLAGDPGAFAAYVVAISEELARLARANGLTTLAYLLDMARLEARSAMELEASADRHR